jgi:hypothetical protein
MGRDQIDVAMDVDPVRDGCWRVARADDGRTRSRAFMPVAICASGRVGGKFTSERMEGQGSEEGSEEITG